MSSLSRILLASIFTILAIPLASAQSCNFRSVSIELRDSSSVCILVTAHRGAHGEAPENSISAIESAIEIGADIIEIDIRFTKDGVPVLLHDETLDRTTTGQGKLAGMAFDEVQKLRLLSKSGEVTNESIPTLSEVLLQAKGRVLLDLDIKTGPIDAIVSRVVETGTVDTAIFFSGNLEVLKRAQSMNQSLLLMPRARDINSTRTIVETFAPEIIHIDPSFNEDATMALARLSDSRVWINALGAPDMMILTGRSGDALEPLLAHGASIIQTDMPKQVLDYLQKTGRR